MKGHKNIVFCPHATHLPVLISSHTEYRVLRIWNVLPHDIDSSSLAGFKRSLSTNILQKFLKVDYILIEFRFVFL